MLFHLFRYFRLSRWEEVRSEADCANDDCPEVLDLVVPHLKVVLAYVQSLFRINPLS